MQDGHTHYTPASGIAELRAAIAQYYKKTYGLDVSAEQVIVSNGAKHSLHNALAATVGPGDEVIIPTPYWVSYSDLVQMTGASYVLVPTTMRSGFKMTPAQLKAAITPRSRLLMLNSPCNPTGTVYTPPGTGSAGRRRPRLEPRRPQRRDLREAGLRRRQGDLLRHAAAGPGRADHHHQRRQQELRHDRLAHGLGRRPAQRRQGDGQRAEPGNEQSVAASASTRPWRPWKATRTASRRCAGNSRRAATWSASGWRRCPGIVCPMPDGAFYAFFNVAAHFGRTLGGKKVTDSASFCQAALESAHVNLVPGSAFGAEGYVRLSFATSREQINGGLDRLEQFLARVT